jgi:hypothetical protein
MEDGSRMMPKKQQDGRFHFQGELVVCPGETQLELLNIMKPVLDAVGNKLAILYLLPHCQDPSSRAVVRIRHTSQTERTGISGWT